LNASPAGYNIVDTSGWLEYFTKGPNVAAFRRPITNPGLLLVPSIVLLEVERFSLRSGRATEALEIVGQMKRRAVIDLDAKLAADAAVAGIKWNLPLADSVIYATAIGHRATRWTQDVHFEGLPRYIPKQL
jgi:toxin FitB